MTEIEKEKLDRLKDFFKQAGSAVIAFSGGVDSTLLAKVCNDVLGNKMLAVTLVSDSFPASERKAAADFCKAEGIAQTEILYNQLEIPGFVENTSERCYFCKKQLFLMIKTEAQKKGFAAVCEGSNMDDMGDYRPGLKAITELDIKSPLKEAGLTKQEIRNILQAYNIPVWNKPSMACLATRIAYGQQITKEKLQMIEKAEQLLTELGFVQKRVRLHGTVARIELLPRDFEKFMKEEIRSRVTEEFKHYGFDYVTLDLQGFRSGSMNEALENIRK